MNKKGQVGILAGIFLLLMFIVMWALWLGSWLNDIGKGIVENNHLVGLEAFAFSNLNLIVFMGVVMGFLGFVYFGARRA